jgi:hypothetical protein
MKRALAITATVTAVLLLWSARVGLPPLPAEKLGRAAAPTLVDGWQAMLHFASLPDAAPWAALRMGGVSKPGREEEAPAWPVSSRPYAVVETTGSELVERTARRANPPLARRSALRGRTGRSERYVPAHDLPLAMGTTYRVPSRG